MEGFFTPWPVNRSSAYLDPEPFQPLRFSLDVVDDKADLTAWRRAGLVTDELWQLGAFKELPYLFFCIGNFLVFWGLFFAFYYVSSNT